MHVLIAPHGFGPLLPSTAATEQLVAGWREARPNDVVEGLPLSDGSAGYLEALAHLGQLDVLTVAGAAGEDLPVGLVRAGTTAYLTTDGWNRDGVQPEFEKTTSRGVGEAMAEAISAGARRLVIAAGDAPWHDAGAGLIEGLADRLDIEPVTATPQPDPALPPGAIGSAALGRLESAHRALAGIDIVVAAQTDTPLLGLHGAGAALADRGLDPAAAQDIEARTTDFIAAAEQAAARWRPLDLLGTTDRRESRRPYSGAGGGVGFILALLGGRLLPGAWVVAEELCLSEAIARADLVVTGGRILADRELSHGVVADVGSRTEPHALPVVVVGGRIDATPRQLATAGVHGAYPVIDTSPGELPDLDQITPEALRVRGGRVARSWSR